MTASRVVRIHSRGQLPHWEASEGTYFVTFRLFDSLPAGLASLRGGKRVEEELDRGRGAAFLKRPDVGAMVFDAVRCFDGKRYFLHSACVMPNHVHAVFRVATSTRLRDVVHAWKSFTAHRANRMLGREGPFWQRESFDRLIRDEHELQRANEYVLANPDKAGLVNWEWVGKWDVPFLVKYDDDDGEAGWKPALHENG